MRYFRIFATGVICLILSGVSNAGNLIIIVEVATQVDTHKVQEVSIVCSVFDVHRRKIGLGRKKILLDDSGSFFGSVPVKIEEYALVSGEADLLANANSYECNYSVRKRGSFAVRTITREADIPPGLESYTGRGGRPFRPAVSGPVRW